MKLCDVIRNTPLREARILAGGKHLDVDVTEGNIIEVPDTVRWMRGKEIVFSSGYAFQGNPALGVKLLTELKAHNISALALKPGKYMRTVPGEMIDKAEELEFTLLEIPADMPYNICLEAIYEQLKAQRITELQKITNLQSMLLDASAHGGAKQVCEVLQARMGRSVTLWNGDWSPRYGDGVSEEMTAQLRGYTVDQTVQIQGENGETLLCFPLHTMLRSHPAYLTILCMETELSQGEKTIGQYAASLLNIELSKEEELDQQYMRLSGTLLDHLLEGEPFDPIILRRRVSPYQINLNDPYVVFACCGRGEEHFSHMEVWHLLYRKAQEFQTGCLLTEKNKCFVGAFFFPEQQSEAAITMFKEAAKEKNNLIIFGLSDIGRSLASFPKLCREAEEALRILRYIPGFRCAARLTDLGIYRVLTELRSSTAMRDMIVQTLGPVLRYDAKMKGELINTLQVYFDNGCNLHKTANVMFLHKNSISYRMRKIEELTGHRLTEPQFSLELQLCLKFLVTTGYCTKSTMKER